MNICDNCGTTIKKHKQKGCKHLFCNMKCRDDFRSKQIPIFSCECCGKLTKKQKKWNHIFCSMSCRDAFRLKKYSTLFPKFQDNLDEVAYLFGLILGDGHLKKSGRNTTRVSIAFNLADIAGFNIAEQILKILEITYFVEPKTPHNCKTLGFVLPNNLLENYGFLFHGKKYLNQPTCTAKENINFAIGLINSDGNLRKNKYIAFCNTVDSIIEDMKFCLKHNNIQFKFYQHKYKNKNWKPRISVYIMQKPSREKILACKYCKWNQ